MKNQVKKSLSLLMAVLMILSCWVWVAPEKAEAKSFYSTYTVKIVANASNAVDNEASVTIKHTGNTSGQKFTWSEAKSDGDATQSFEVSGWPSSINFYLTTKTMTEHKITVTQIWINDVCIFNNTYTMEKGWLSDGKTNETLTYNGKWGNWSFSSYWTQPKFTDMREIQVSPDEIDVGKLPDKTSTKTATVSIKNGYDQYGVPFDGTVPSLTGVSYALKYTDANGQEQTFASNSTQAKISGSTQSGTVTVYNDVQTLFPNATNGKIYAYVTYNGETRSTPINLTFPTYDITFDANGGKIGSSDSDIKDQIVNSGIKYGGVIGKSPAYRTKDGFEFKGFYSVKNADANGLTPSFSGTLYEDSETTVGTQGDMTYYAAWQATPVTATFLTADNQLIGTVEGRYYNYLTAGNMYNGITNLNAKVKAAYTGNKIQFDGNNAPVYKDGNQAYTFSHWQIVKAYDESILDGHEDTVLKGDVTFKAVYTKADATKYTVSFEDGAGNVLKDANGNEYKKTDYKYRELVTNVPAVEPVKTQDDRYSYDFIGWAKKLADVQFIAVDENDKDANGGKVVYTSKDADEFIVKGDVTYIPVFRTTEREYEVTFNYTTDNNVPSSITVGGYHWGDTVKMPEIKDNYTAGGYRYTINGWMINSYDISQLADIKIDEDFLENGLTLTASYGDGVGAEYTINFYNIDKELINEGSNIYTHNSEVTAPPVPNTIDTPDSLYTFAAWSPAVNTTATGDADYYATYTKKDYADVHFYNYDGTPIYSLDGKENTKFVGDVIPKYSNIIDGVNVLPAKAEDAVGTYKFIGWKDSNGKDVDPGTTKFTGDTYLTAQFETVYKDYTVKFLNDDGSVVSEKTYHYATEIEVPENPTKKADATYNYEFRAWTPDVSKVCYGDATYTATYRRDFNYYQVTWLKDNKTVLSESNYKYDAKIQQAVMNAPVAYPDATAGYKWALKHWVQCDANGNAIDGDAELDGVQQVIFTRGSTKMGTEHLYFYPVFEEVANVLTVTFYKEDGTTEIGKASVPYGEALEAYSGAFKKDAPKAADETYHYSIDKWVNINGGADVTYVTANVSVKPSYTAAEHTKDDIEIIKAPTCTEKGLANVSCSADECDKKWENTVLEIIPDESKPNGQIYVGTAKWTSNDIVDRTITTFIGPDTKLVVNAEDIGSVSENNPDGKLSRGVGKIEYYIRDTFTNDTSILDEDKWTTIYDFDLVTEDVLEDVLKTKGMSMDEYDKLSESDNTKVAIDAEVAAIQATYKANATGVVSNLGLEDGKDYVIYIRVSDRTVGGSCNSAIFCSGKLHYDEAAPGITLTGKGHGAQFCEEASVRVSDNANDIEIYLDGDEVEAYTNPGTTAANGTFVASFKVTEKGVHTVTAIDKNGNKSTQTFEIKGDHTTRHYVINASCENAGSKYDLCIICGTRSNEEVIPAKGHAYNTFTDKAPTCTVDGYRTYTCDNNCGIKLVVNPTDGDDKFDQVPDTHKAAIEALMATGVHTYAKVQDENGVDTAEDAWVIDKTPTCTVEGSKHKDCIVCGRADARVTEVIPVDTADGHKFYRAKVTTEATCTAQGEKTKTCRYCGKVEHVEYIDMLGHTEGEYRINLEPVCQASGNKIMTCANCGVDMGDYIEIPALGCAWKLDGDIKKVEDKVDDEIVTIYVQYYKCSRCGESKKEILEDYVEPKEVAVTFMNGEAEVAKLTKFVGEAITAADVAEPSKTADATKTYKFSHWADAQGKAVEFPIEVKDNATYYAVFTDRYVNYTITYYKEDGITEYKKTGYLHNGETVNLAAGPAKADDQENTYTFAGWEVIGSDPAIIYTDAATINGANINLAATYTSAKKSYAITYAYSSSNILETFAVEAGTVARDCRIPVEKAYDAKYHYEFIKWNRAEMNEETNKYEIKVLSNVYTTPEFEAIEHDYNITTETAAACGVNRFDRYTCKYCDYTYTKEVYGSALDHEWGTPVFNEETGKNVVTCTREGCGDSQEDTRSYTAKFFVNADDNRAISTASHIEWGTTIDGRLPADPTKDSTSTYDYIFKGWAVKGTTAVVDFTKLTIKQNYDFVAVFEEVLREYKVTFAYDAYNVIQVITGVTAGSSVTFSKAEPTKAPDANGHYKFTGWSGSTENVQSDVYVTAKFAKYEHTYTESDLGTATCTNGKGTRYICECGYYYDVTSDPLPHTMDEVDRKDPTATEDGWIKYECSVCGAKDEKILPAQPTTAKVSVVVDRNGAAASNIKVVVQVLGEEGTESTITTNAKGVATLEVAKDKEYVAWVEIDGVLVPVTLTKDSSGNFNGYYSIKVEAADDDADCGCACHRTNFWGTIFRFFHKIIKMFTGEFKCCKNPDPMYG